MELSWNLFCTLVLVIKFCLNHFDFQKNNWNRQINFISLNMKDQKLKLQHFIWIGIIFNVVSLCFFAVTRFLFSVLGFRRAGPVAGRTINITHEIERFLTSAEMLDTFYTSPANNRCFYGKCIFYCTIEYAFCGHGDMINGSAAAFLPMFEKRYETVSI